MTATDYRMTRRNILIGAAASLICAPAIVRAASLMPVRGLPLQFLNPEFLDPLGQFYRRNFYHSLDSDLRAGRAMSCTVSDGKILSVAEAHRMVARARAEGWLPPYSPTIQVADPKRVLAIAHAYPVQTHNDQSLTMTKIGDRRDGWRGFEGRKFLTDAEHAIYCRRLNYKDGLGNLLEAKRITTDRAPRTGTFGDGILVTFPNSPMGRT